MDQSLSQFTVIRPGLDVSQQPSLTWIINILIHPVHGYADRKFNKHDPDSLHGVIWDFLNSASLQGELPKTPESLSQCSFIKHDSKASALKEVTKSNGILKGYHWYPDTLHRQERSVLKTRSGTVDPSQSTLPATGANQEDMSNNPYGVFGDLNRQEVMGLRGPKSIVPHGMSNPSSTQSS